MILSAPMTNVTLPLGHSPAKFNCLGRGSFLLWKINGTPVTEEREPPYIDRGFTFLNIPPGEDRIRNITLTVDVNTARNNNTVLDCHATGQPEARDSEDITLTIAGIQ